MQRIVLPRGVTFAIFARMPPKCGLFAATVVTIIAAIRVQHRSVHSELGTGVGTCAAKERFPSKRSSVLIAAKVRFPPFTTDAAGLT